MPRGFFRKHFFLPSEHGAWIWWIGPMAIGLAAGSRPTGVAAVLALAALAIFMLRQPAAIAVKALSGRRPRADLAPSLLWVAIELSIAIAALAVLVLAGHTRLLFLGLPGALVFLWHLWLIHRRSERGQMGIELVGAGVLALAAPAAYWVSGGASDGVAWLLWGLTWLQSAASIVFVYLRLAQRRLAAPPARRERWRMGARALAYYTFNLALSAGLVIAGMVPWGVPIAFALMLVDALEGIAHPAIGAKPSAIGLRQLGVSSLFVVVMIMAYSL